MWPIGNLRYKHFRDYRSYNCQSLNPTPKFQAYFNYVVCRNLCVNYCCWQNGNQSVSSYVIPITVGCSSGGSSGSGSCGSSGWLSVSVGCISTLCEERKDKCVRALARTATKIQKVKIPITVNWSAGFRNLNIFQVIGEMVLSSYICNRYYTNEGYDEKTKMGWISLPKVQD